ncbi:MAG TPA: TlpA disulfide reductase family protein [Pyrinomonadaceae bacterium]|nr:TlpA disulfide reductase family protein [Pyrinomonadaceae bacterium]
MSILRINYSIFGVLTVALLFALGVSSAIAQSRPAAKELFFDSDGNQVSNNEFVDIRMANFHYPDATVVKKYEDGRVEFRLQKIPQEGMVAPKFSVRTVEGKAISLADLKGKVVVLNFWFIGCPACLDMEPKLNAFKTKFAGNDEVVFLAMTADPPGQLKKYLSKVRFDYEQAAGAKAAMDMFVFAGFPKNIVIGKTGEIVYWRSTIKAWDKFESVVRRELDR